MDNTDNNIEIFERISTLLNELRLHLETTVTQKKNPLFRCQSELIHHLHRIYKARAAIFGHSCFNDTAWQLLLELFKSDYEKERVYVSSLCVTSDRSQTTALRCLADLEEAGLITRNPDSNDKRRVLVTLTAASFSAMSELCKRLS